MSMGNGKTGGYLLIPDGEGEKPAVITLFHEPETQGGGVRYRCYQPATGV